mmetsp:Transcript_23123/g.55754  ORF Transcript_23123/g.55754 Transcript_23123/m.55754 type:complete len:233 (+) Transcript_23123:301-999(+)
MSEPPPSAPAFPAAPSRHAQRWAAEEQPRPVANPKGSASKQWYVYARIGRMGTGKASMKRIEEISPKLFGATEEECYMKQGSYINDYMHPKQRVRKAAEQVADEPSGSNSEDATQGGCWRAKHQRLAAPRESLAMPRQVGGARSGARPGPGRGHTYESTMPIETQFLFPPLPKTVGGNWLEQLSLRKKWQTERIEHLERQVEELLVVNATQAAPEARSNRSSAVSRSAVSSS